MATKNYFFSKFFAYYFLKLHLHHFSKMKSHKEAKKQWESRFFLLFCLMVEGSGSIPRNNGSGSGSRRPKNIRLLRIRIRNTAPHLYKLNFWMPCILLYIFFLGYSLLRACLVRASPEYKGTCKLL